MNQNVYLIKLDCISQLQNEVALSLVSEKKRKKLACIKNSKAKAASLLGELLLRLVAMQKYGIPNQAITIDTDEFGKPFVIELPDFHANISHSGELVACVTDVEEVGIDIEAIEKADLNIAKRFFTAMEYEWLLSLPDSGKDAGFYKLWTLKESYIKQQGRGFAIPLCSFSFDMSKSPPCLVGQPDPNLHFFCDTVNYNYSLSICCKSMITKVGYKYIEIDELQLLLLG